MDQGPHLEGLADFTEAIDETVADKDALEGDGMPRVRQPGLRAPDWMPASSIKAQGEIICADTPDHNLA